MKWKRAPFVGTCGVIVLLFITLESSCRESPADFESLEGFEQFRDRILSYSNPDFEVLEVVDEGRALRVDLAVTSLPADRLQTRVQASNALFALQSLVGNEISMSVWLYGSSRKDSSDLLGMAFYHALTEQLVFKSSKELREREEDTP